MVAPTLKILLSEPAVFLPPTSPRSDHDLTASELDVPPAQVRGIVRLSLPRPARIKDITIMLRGQSRTDWPEGLKQNGIEMVEQVDILRLSTSIFRTGSGLPLSLGHAGMADHDVPVVRSTSVPQQMWPEEMRERERDRSPMMLPLPYRQPPSAHQALRSMRGLLDGLRTPRTSPDSEQPPPLSLPAPSSPPVQAEWFELRKGEYEYPFSLSLPADLPPTLHADFGHVMYELKATVFRSGPLASNVTAEREVTLVQTPPPAAPSAADSILLQRFCEDMLSYTVAIDENSFPIGTSIPVHLTFVPLGKTRIHRLVFALEEKTDYYANERKTMRHEMPRKWSLLRLQRTDGDGPLLPLDGEDADVLKRSPLRPYIEAAAAQHAVEAEDILVAPLDPTGPWRLSLDLPVTMERQAMINISCQHPKSNIHIFHVLKITIRVESLDGDPRILDIVIGVPILLTHSKTSLEWVRLPQYEETIPPPPPLSPPPAVSDARRAPAVVPASR
ncbi:hypothetical protein MEQU1_002615 [Malassezia equina]|uniref:Arrestin C-terminal-like domain-containing protein n=1 Tax=Malassezia equina TaxID=1381935 RepID=A0AAF0EG22_9BASI|nr:hypothetical protein MEQU1_002615 [Malassezia equina]